MGKDMKFELIIAVVNGGFSSKVVDAAKEAGAGGATLIKGRGTGIHETDNFLGVRIQPEKDIIIILSPKSDRNKIMQAIVEQAGLSTEGQGLCFSLPVEDWSGICHLNKMIDNESGEVQEFSCKRKESEELENDENINEIKPKLVEE